MPRRRVAVGPWSSRARRTCLLRVVRTTVPAVMAGLTAAAGSEGLRLGLFVTTFGFGVRHGIDWDHIAALSDLTSSQQHPRRSMVVATLYVLGHAMVVLLLGCVAILFADELPSSVDGAMERVVGVTLLALGAYVLWSLVRHGRSFRMRSRWMLVFAAARRVVRWITRERAEVVVIDHEHEHDIAHPHVEDHDHERVAVGAGAGGGAAAAVPHRHPHRHVAVVPDDPFAGYGNVTAWVVGMLHGIGAETPTQVLLFLTAAGAAGKGAGIALLLCFIVGLITSNTAIALATTYGFLRATGSFRVYAGVSVVIAAFSIVVGGLFVAGAGNVLPAFFSS